MPGDEAVVYTREGCHLCTEAAELLTRHGLPPRLVDIDADPDLIALYDECVPVVVIDGKERFRGRIDERLLRRLVRQRRAAPHSTPRLESAPTRSDPLALAPFELALFAKHWRPGQVKTRLAAVLTPELAAKIYRELLRATLARLGRCGTRRVVCFAPPDAREAFAQFCPADWELRPQSAGDLGARLADHFATSFAGGAERAIVVGSDSPHLSPEIIGEAAAALDSAPVALGPTRDGGYYLVAARDRVPPIFTGIDWGTPAVWEQTTAQLAAAGLACATLPTSYDVDNIDDLARLRRELLTTTDDALLALRDALDVLLANSSREP